MSKLTQFLASLFVGTSEYTYPAQHTITTIESTTRRRQSSKHNPKTRSIRLIVESVIGKNYTYMFSDKLKNGRKVKFYKMHIVLSDEQLSEINDGLSKLDVTAVRHDNNSLVVKYWNTCNEI